MDRDFPGVLPQLWGADLLSLWGILFTGLGALVGLWWAKRAEWPHLGGCAHARYRRSSPLSLSVGRAPARPQYGTTLGRRSRPPVLRCREVTGAGEGAWQ